MFSGGLTSYLVSMGYEEALEGFDVEIADPGGSVDGFRNHTDWRTQTLDHELIIVAAPLRISNDIQRLLLRVEGAQDISGEQLIGQPVLLPEFPQFTGAHGAALYALVAATDRTVSKKED